MYVSADVPHLFVNGSFFNSVATFMQAQMLSTLIECILASNTQHFWHVLAWIPDPSCLVNLSFLISHALLCYILFRVPYSVFPYSDRDGTMNFLYSVKFGKKDLFNFLNCLQVQSCSLFFCAASRC